MALVVPGDLSAPGEQGPSYSTWNRGYNSQQKPHFCWKCGDAREGDWDVGTASSRAPTKPAAEASPGPSPLPAEGCTPHQQGPPQAVPRPPHSRLLMRPVTFCRTFQRVCWRPGQQAGDQASSCPHVHDPHSSQSVCRRASVSPCEWQSGRRQTFQVPFAPAWLFLRPGLHTSSRASACQGSWLTGRDASATWLG